MSGRHKGITPPGPKPGGAVFCPPPPARLVWVWV